MLAIAADGLAVNNAAHAIGLTICPSAKHTLDIVSFARYGQMVFVTCAFERGVEGEMKRRSPPQGMNVGTRRHETET